MPWVREALQDAAEVAMAPKSSRVGTSTPLLIAVTGHRTLSAEHAPTVAEQVRQALTDIQALMPHTTIRIVSGLAEGADRIVAQAGLDLGMEVEVVVAVPVGRYRSGFTAASRDDFDAFLRSPGVALTEVPEGDDPGGGSVGKEAAPYVAVGRYLASRANLLFALWDGEPDRIGWGYRRRLAGLPGSRARESPRRLNCGS